MILQALETAWFWLVWRWDLVREASEGNCWFAKPFRTLLDYVERCICSCAWSVAQVDTLCNTCRYLGSLAPECHKVVQLGTGRQILSFSICITNSKSWTRVIRLLTKV